MAKKEKLIQEIKNNKRISSEEGVKLLNNLGFMLVKKKGSSHQSYLKGQKLIVILLNKKELPDYLIRQFQEIIKEEGL